MTGVATNQEIAWSDDFLIGIDELDYEHRKLIEDINQLHRELAEHVEADRVEATLGSIHSRMQAHFALEESVMTAHKYPYYQEHKAEHEQLLDEYAEFMTKFGRQPDSGDRDAIQARLQQWIVDHILTRDRKMSLMVRNTPRSNRSI